MSSGGPFGVGVKGIEDVPYFTLSAPGDTGRPFGLVQGPSLLAGSIQPVVVVGDTQRSTGGLDETRRHAYFQGMQFQSASGNTFTTDPGGAVLGYSLKAVEPDLQNLRDILGVTANILDVVEDAVPASGILNFLATAANIADKLLARQVDRITILDHIAIKGEEQAGQQGIGVQIASNGAVFIGQGIPPIAVLNVTTQRTAAEDHLADTTIGLSTGIYWNAPNAWQFPQTLDLKAWKVAVSASANQQQPNLFPNSTIFPLLLPPGKWLNIGPMVDAQGVLPINFSWQEWNLNIAWREIPNGAPG